ncbi:MAG: NADH:flavin oxidoreductase [Armatimonadota bacterium]|nr:MAG: NADH:flavin oxidoreductase [Armatimonadota bacterium]
MPRLFDAIQIPGTALRLRNRVVMPPMNMDDAGPGGVVTDEVIEHYVARAQGGVGLIIVAAAYVRDDGKLSRNQLGISRDEHVEPLSRLAKAIKERGAAAAIQIHHAGGVADAETIGGTAVAPSAEGFPDRDVKELSVQEIRELVEAFGAAAARAKAAGFDAVELHGAHGYLVTQFLSPATNRRDDDYGGTSEKRLRFALECVDAIRKATGQDYPIITRISAKEDAPGGLTIEDGCRIAKALDDAGACIVHVSASLASTGERGWGYMVPLAEAVKRAVSVPVIAVGKLHDPKLANSVIEEGKADLVAIGSQLLAQPDWPQAAAEALGQEMKPL